MAVKVYNVLGVGFIIGEKLSQDKEFIYLQYPSIYSPQMQTRDGPRDIMFEAIPQFFKGRDEMLKRFHLKKSLIIFSGQPGDDLFKSYEVYAAQLRTRITGLRVVGPETMKNLPPLDKNGKPIKKH